MDQHWVNVNRGAEDAAAELGVDLTWLAPDVKDDAKQIECINNAVAAGADCILLAANGPEACVAALKEASEAGVEIVYVDSAANFPGRRLLATDNRAGGRQIGERLIQELTANGITSGMIGVIGVNAATESCNQREYAGMPSRERISLSSRHSTARVMLLRQRIWQLTSSHRDVSLSTVLTKARQSASATQLWKLDPVSSAAVPILPI